MSSVHAIRAASTRTAIASSIVIALGASITGCSDDLTQLMLVLDTDLDVPSEASALRVQITGASGRTYEAGAELGADRPATLALVPPEGERGGTLSVIAEVMLDGERVASRTVTTSFVEGRVKAVPICVARTCAGACADLDAPGGSLADWNGTAPMPCDAPPPPSDVLGRALFIRQISDGIFMNRIELREGATIERLSDVFEDELGESETPDDRDAALSPSGEWMVANIARGSCLTWGCIHLGRADDPTSMRPMQVRWTADTLLHGNRATVTDDGEAVLYEGEPAVEGHEGDVWITRRVDGEWGAPVALSTDSTFPYNKGPRLSFDGARVVFSCSHEIYGYDAICEVAIDGTGYREVLRPDQAPDPLVAERSTSLDYPRYEIDGSIVFSTTWSGAQLWRMRPEARDPVRVLGPFDDGLHQACPLRTGHLVALRGAVTSPPGPTLAVYTPTGTLLYELGVDYVTDQLTWLNDCGP